MHPPMTSAAHSNSTWLADRRAWTWNPWLSGINSPKGNAYLTRDQIGCLMGYEQGWESDRDPNEAAILASCRNLEELSGVVAGLVRSGLAHEEARGLVGRLAAAMDDPASVVAVGRDAVTGIARSLLHFTRRVEVTPHRPISYSVRIEEAVSFGDPVPECAARASIFPQLTLDTLAILENCKRTGTQPDVDISCVPASPECAPAAEFATRMVDAHLALLKAFADEDWPYSRDTTLERVGSDAGRITAPQALIGMRM